MANASNVEPEPAGERDREPAPPVARGASLRRRLGLLGLATLIISLGLVGLALDAAYRRSAVADLERQMETWVYLVLAATEFGPDGELRVGEGLGDPLLAQPGSGVYAHLHGETDHWSSPSALGLALPELTIAEPGDRRFQAPSGEFGYYSLGFGLAWELADGARLPVTATVLVAPDWLAPRLGSFRRGLWRSLGLAGVLLALAQLAFLYLSLRPLRRVARDVARIERGEQEALGADYPLELQPLSRNLERLLRTEKSNRERYRSALDSLAHSLKTPLAVLRARLEAGGETDMDPVVRDAVEDMHRLVATRLQRAASTTRRTLAAPVPVAPVAERLAKALRRVHSHRLRTLDLKLEPGLEFYGEERDLLELLGNLLENACKYGSGRVALGGGVIDAHATRPGVWFTVDNEAAPGVRGEDLERYLPRGARGDESSQAQTEGQGLGLAIVSEIVKAYGGSITFGPADPDARDGQRGVRVAVRLPPA